MLFDSCVLIDALNGHGVAQSFIEMDTTQKISVVTRAEVIAGIQDMHALPVAMTLLDTFTNQQVSLAIADSAGRLRMLYKLKTSDALIVATAIALDETLVTRDRCIIAIPAVQTKSYTI